MKKAAAKRAKGKRGAKRKSRGTRANAHNRPQAHPEFLRQVADARTAIRDGRGVRLEDIPD